VARNFVALRPTDWSILFMWPKVSFTGLEENEVHYDWLLKILSSYHKDYPSHYYVVGYATSISAALAAETVQLLAFILLPS